ncbi:hypothetical protein FLAVO9AF_30045 [Flavobacterium sp. 9AF]|nr:hypothetical protein FLAVO9AF_30045 [Flavobacterium sp. 9AF]
MKLIISSSYKDNPLVYKGKMPKKDKILKLKCSLLYIGKF